LLFMVGVAICFFLTIFLIFHGLSYLDSVTP
jgi:hypothetical protein